ncbi:TIGR03084 family metal-binding protein [Saccharopolyspora indica]|uniref:TIGR03084 family metal-binding protein n=1 Tax=Saccharopolyspora indica TaxID=1229659 RepID=UPI0022EAEF9B|nr:TIGR03084 family metal-binding protein [Saccharopolyspora indica]MDA3646995.1 TIGR03084 family metal-binding protein [Saccharopolyspora indica]
MRDLQGVIDDLTAEATEVDRLVADLTEEQWELPTPAPGWSIKHQIGHLAFIFQIAGMAAARPDDFRAMAEQTNRTGFDSAVNAVLENYVHDPSEVLLARWRDERDTGIKALAAVSPDQVVPWLVNPLPPVVLGCAGMMELFAHGQDVADALGVRVPRTDRIRNLVGFAVRTWEFGYQSRGLTPPDVEFGFDLVGPSGARWTFGPEDAEQRITGSAEDFCLLVTRRRHRDDLAVSAVGADAEHWLDIAQAYRGPAGPGREPGQFASRS